MTRNSVSEIIFVEQFVTAHWHPSTRTHYESLGYVFSRNRAEFQVRPHELSVGSHVRVRVRCPLCSNERDAPFKSVFASGNSICKRCTDVRDLTGEQFGRLTVIRPTDRRSGKNLVWECQCVCGNTVYANSGLLSRDGMHCCNRGVCNARWNEGLSREQRFFHRGKPHYREWRTSVFERDGYACQACGDNKGGNLIAHHLDSWDQHIESRFDIANGGTLCDLCHKEFHDAYGYGGNTRAQYQEFIHFRTKNSVIGD